MEEKHKLEQAIEILNTAKHTVAFTGAGISVESGIPPFRGPGGLWSKYDPIILDLDYYKRYSNKSWPVIKKLFFDFFGSAIPNDAHLDLAKMEQEGSLIEIITQNIDNLHQEAGSKKVYEFHGNSQKFVCMDCGSIILRNELVLTEESPHCLKTKCNGLLKPDFIFFGEGIPADAYEASIQAAKNADVFILIGTTGEIMPASQIPFLAKQNGAKIIEINITESSFTSQITDVFLKGKATDVLNKIITKLVS
ncbi:MAG: NAD-dependent deacylase [Bacteroidales bacterium]|nr:NAD-dependent deacylase [Bacteroidales bacterium]